MENLGNFKDPQTEKNAIGGTYGIHSTRGKNAFSRFRRRKTSSRSLQEPMNVGIPNSYPKFRPGAGRVDRKAGCGGAYQGERHPQCLCPRPSKLRMEGTRDARSAPYTRARSEWRCVGGSLLTDACSASGCQERQYTEYMRRPTNFASLGRRFKEPGQRFWIGSNHGVIDRQSGTARLGKRGKGT